VLLILTDKVLVHNLGKVLADDLDSLFVLFLGRGRVL
jgi:hypothetical protein